MSHIATFAQTNFYFFLFSNVKTKKSCPRDRRKIWKRRRNVKDMSILLFCLAMQIQTRCWRDRKHTSERKENLSNMIFIFLHNTLFKLLKICTVFIVFTLFTKHWYFLPVALQQQWEEEMEHQLQEEQEQLEGQKWMSTHTLFTEEDDVAKVQRRGVCP